ncbi:MAG: ATP-binding cassette domain-containing protein, partial [Thermocrispum sp.]
STVATGLPAAETPTREVIRLMTGQAIAHAFPERAAARPVGELLLSVRGLARPGEFTDVSFDVRAGEVVGLAGLVGSGRSEILETIFGARKASAGTVTVDGRKVRPGKVSAAVAAGIGLCPEERKSQALVLDDAVYRNVTMANLPRFARGGFLDRSRERSAAAEHVLSLDVRPTGVDRAVRTLSGGNQQKVVLARWLLRDCKVLLLDEPTRGVDVGARAQLYDLIGELAGGGLAVVVVSSEIAEVIGLSDRVLVISDGQLVADTPAGQIDEDDVLGMVMEGEVA